MTRCLRKNTALTVLNGHNGQLTPPVTQVLGDPIPFSDLHGQLHSHVHRATDTPAHI